MSRMHCYTQPVFCEYNYKFPSTRQNNIGLPCDSKVQFIVKLRSFTPAPHSTNTEAARAETLHTDDSTVCSPDRRTVHSTLK